MAKLRKLCDGEGDLLQVVPCDPEDSDTQRCRLGPKLMEEYGLRLGTWVEICHERGKLLCSVWPRKDLCNGLVQADCLVAHHNETKRLRLDRGTIRANLFRPLPVTFDLSRVAVSVVLSTPINSLDPRRNSAALSDQIKELILGCAISSGYTVSFKKCSPVSLIEHVLINRVETGEGNGVAEGQTGIVTVHTNVTVSDCVSRELFQQQVVDSSSSLDGVGGLDKPAQTLKEILTYPLEHASTLRRLGLESPRGVLLVGPPGVGKTSLVRSVARDCGACLVRINAPDVFGPRPGDAQANLSRHFERARQLGRQGCCCIVFVDELDALCPRRDRHGSRGQEDHLVTHLAGLMDAVHRWSWPVLVIGATNRPNAVDLALRRSGRFDREVAITVPNAQQRRSILEVHSNGLRLADDVDLDLIADATGGYVGADIAALCREASFSALGRARRQVSEEVAISLADFKVAMGRTQPSTRRGSQAITTLRPVNWSDIGGLDNVKAQIKQTVEWPLKYSEAFRRLGIKPAKGVLLHGPPGCSKTTLVRAAATSCGATFLSLSGATIYSPYVGDSEKTISKIFHQARLGAPAIIFLDEVDSIVGKRGGGKAMRGVQERVLSTLLNEMDGVGISQDQGVAPEPEQRGADTDQHGKSDDSGFHGESDGGGGDILLVAATNRPDLLDQALLRPGRIDRIVYVPPPDQEARQAVLRVHTKNMPLAKDVDLDIIAEKTELFSGADLENLCREASLCALQSDGLDAQVVTEKHFDSALIASAPSLTCDQLKFYQDWVKNKQDLKP